MECVRYSPTASSTAVTGPSPPRLSTSDPLGAFHPLGLLPQAESEVSDAPASAAPEKIIKAAPAARQVVRRFGKCMSAPTERVCSGMRAHSARHAGRNAIAAAARTFSRRGSENTRAQLLQRPGYLRIWAAILSRSSCSAMEANIAHRSFGLGEAKLRNARHISSVVCSPQVTSFGGLLGWRGLSAELS